MIMVRIYCPAAVLVAIDNAYSGMFAMILSYTVAHVRIQFDYIFHTDGTIEVRVSASGYLQAGFWEPTQEGYGTAIRQTTSEFLFPSMVLRLSATIRSGVTTRPRHQLQSRSGRAWNKELAAPHAYFTRAGGAAVVRRRLGS